MSKTNRIILPIVTIQFCAEFCENLFKSLITTFIAFAALQHLGLKNSQVISLINFVIVLPILLLSSYSGKISDSYNKVKVLRSISVGQVLIALIAMIAIYLHIFPLLVIAMIAISVQLTFLHPIKYSILPSYLGKEHIGIATSYITFSAFISILAGQVTGSYLAAINQPTIIIYLSLGCGIISSIASLTLLPVTTSKCTAISYSKNPIIDSYRLYKQVAQNKLIRLNLHILSWFWAYLALNTSLLALFVANYIGASNKVLSLILGIDAAGIALGAIICARLNNGSLKPKTILYSGLVMTIINFYFLTQYHDSHIRHTIIINSFITTSIGKLILVLFLLKSIAAGFYAITCYTELQVLSPDHLRSRIMATVTVMSALYILIASLICTIVQSKLTSWGVLMIVTIIHLVFVLIYQRKIKQFA